MPEMARRRGPRSSRTRFRFGGVLLLPSALLREDVELLLELVLLLPLVAVLAAIGLRRER